ncbi:hypothetical protein [Peribacillus muralis]|uniref:hypothetical protein n=1 Tax=Peribacillus muralis TaxID=264697 RepID=UPI00137AEDFC|nr:hypothetical protein [Peribacillus muralis]
MDRSIALQALAFRGVLGSQSLPCSACVSRDSDFINGVGIKTFRTHSLAMFIGC